MKRHFITLASLVALGGISLATGPCGAAERPNILLIFADDCGIDAFNCYGSDRAASLTPHIDALAKSGVRFTHCFSTPLCGPSRCLLITGRYGFRTGGTNNRTAHDPSYRDEPSMARILKEAGYATGMAGKWRQMSDAPADWGFDEYITDPTAGGWYGQDWYFKNGEKITPDHDGYYPDVTSDFALEFIRRHKKGPFFFYYATHLIHGPIRPTPDSQPDAPPHQQYNDNIAYLDKLVGKLVDGLEKMGLREETVVVFTTDNGTSRIGYQEKHDPKNLTGNINGCQIEGRKGMLLEGGSRVPLIVSWKGTLSPGGVCDDLIDFSDFLPTFAELASAKLPEQHVFDGRSFAPRLWGEAGNPREWVFVQLSDDWYVRNDNWKLTRDGTLYSMDEAPFAEMTVARRFRNNEAVAARKALQAVLGQLNPDGKEGTPKTKPGKKRRRGRRQN